MAHFVQIVDLCIIHSEQA